MNTNTIHQQTGAAWDQAATNYERSETEHIDFLRSGGNTLLAPEQRILGDLRPWCHCAIHLQCAGGTDTLSLLAQGAQEVVGTDISPRMIGVARRKAEALGAPAAFFVCDTLEAPHELDGTADLVYTGRGALAEELASALNFFPPSCGVANEQNATHAARHRADGRRGSENLWRTVFRRIAT